MAKLNPRIVNKLKQIPDVAVAAAARAMEEGAEEIVQAMKAAVPADSGALRDSIGWTWGELPPGSFMIDEIRSGTSRGDQYATLRIRIYAGDSDIFYARFVEFGTQAGDRNARVQARATDVNQNRSGRKSYRTHPGTPAQPFFFPTWKQMRNRYRNKIRAAVRAAIKEAWRNG